MRKLVVLALLAAVVTAVAASSAAAKPPGTNGLISFTRFEPALQQDVVYTINPDGSGEHPLLVGAESGHWSPDGSRILVGPDCCAERILNPDNGSYNELPTFYPDLGLFLGCGVWSPDAARLACEGFGDQPSADGVYTIRSSDGGDVRRVTSGADDDYPGDYSPNGKRIVFLRSSFDSGPARALHREARRLRPAAAHASRDEPRLHRWQLVAAGERDPVLRESIRRAAELDLRRPH